MDRRRLMHRLGTLGLTSLLPARGFALTHRAGRGAGEEERHTTGCFLTPQETEGPYYFNPNLVRKDIRSEPSTGEIKTGLPLNLLFSLVDTNCNPVSNVLVDIWHCDKDGVYSGYAGQPGGVSTVGQSFLRGTQLTDANGQCSFLTIYPGWYQGRVTHIHFKARLTSTTYVTSQFAFPDNLNTEVYNTTLYVGKGQNPVTNATDSIFQSANPENEMVALLPNAGTGGYDGTFTIGINAPTGLAEPDADPRLFRLEPNYPNPFGSGAHGAGSSTMIRYTVPETGSVRLDVHDVFGRDVAVLVDSVKKAGTHEIAFDARSLESGFYFCRLTAGSFGMSREMLYLK